MMAYDGTIYASVSGSGFTSSCLEGIPFKIGPRFKPPTKIILPPDVDLQTSSRSSVLNSEYSFEVEEAVLKWSAEREKQKEEKLELQRQATLRKSQESSSSDGQADQDESDAGPPGAENLEPAYENTRILQPQPAPRPKPRHTNAYTNVTIPSSVYANVSNNILQPTPIQTTDKVEEKSVTTNESSSKNADFDLTWFEKQDDPFDNLELKTINDMEELASVLEQTHRISPNIDDTKNTVDPSDIKDNNVKDEINEQDVEDEEDAYENVSLVMIKNGLVNSNTSPNSALLDLTKLPPVPPRRDLVGRSSPLPPIGQTEVNTQSAVDSQPQSQTQNSVISHTQNCASSINNSSSEYNNENTSSSFQTTDSTTGKSISHKAPVKKPPRTFKYSRHVDTEPSLNGNVAESNSDNVQTQNKSVNLSLSDGNFSVQFLNSQSNPKTSDNSDSELKFDSDHFGDKQNSRPVPAPRKTHSPPPRPSSGQSWNPYNPLPPTPTPSYSIQPATVALPGYVSPDNGSYTRLTKEAQTSVDNLVSMGFSRDRVIRAVEKLGEDEKEIVEFLCLVDQLTEKGYSAQLAETALLMFRNSMQQASSFLELFTQFQELGFSGDKIKEALVNTNNDREKTLDILTASS